MGRASAAIHSALGSFVVGVVAEEQHGSAPARRLYAASFHYLSDARRRDIDEATTALLRQDAWLHPRYRVELATMFDNLKDRPLRPLGRRPGSTGPARG